MKTTQPVSNPYWRKLHSRTAFLVVGGIALVALFISFIFWLAPDEWWMGLRPYYFSCPERHGLKPPHMAAQGPNAEMLWRDYETPQRERLQTGPAFDPEGRLDFLKNQRAHFIAESQWTSDDILMGRPVYLERSGWPGTPYSDEELKELGESWSPDRKTIIDDLTGLPVLIEGDSISSSQEGHWEARLAVAKWYATRGVYAVNSTKRQRP
jgi:hypothetical protein